MGAWLCASSKNVAKSDGLTGDYRDNFNNVNYNNASSTNSSEIRAQSLHDITTTTGITNAIKKLNDNGNSNGDNNIPIVAVDNSSSPYDEQQRSYKSWQPIKVTPSTTINTTSLAESQFFVRSAVVPEHKNHHLNHIGTDKLEDISVFHDAYDDLSKVKEQTPNIIRVDEKKYSSSSYTSDMPIIGHQSKVHSNALQTKKEDRPRSQEHSGPSLLQNNIVLPYSYTPSYAQNTYPNDLIIVEPVEVKSNQDFIDSPQTNRFNDLSKHYVHEQPSYNESKSLIKLKVSSEIKSPVFNVFERLKPVGVTESDSQYENDDNNYSLSSMAKVNQRQSERQSTSDFDTVDEYPGTGMLPSLIIERSAVVLEPQPLTELTTHSNQNSGNNSFLDVSIDEERFRRSRSPSRETPDVSYNNELSVPLSLPVESVADEMHLQEQDNDSSASISTTTTTTLSRSNQVHLPVEKQRAVSEVLRKRNSMQKVADYKRSFQKTNTLDESDTNDDSIVVKQQQQRTLPISKSDLVLSSITTTKDTNKNNDANSTIMKQKRLNKALSFDAQFETLEKNEDDGQRIKCSIERLNKLLSTSSEELNSSNSEHLRQIQNTQQ
ncbi:unnamed protein product [Didymodactylos carnosus]|nr:unnamed protein product [Didymodactylos carnosus]CAF3981000.1 unnamed protein product [Didymodactylos carnosus]